MKEGLVKTGGNYLKLLQRYITKLIQISFRKKKIEIVRSRTAGCTNNGEEAMRPYGTIMQLFFFGLRHY